jgi:hypothetical protein
MNHHQRLKELYLSEAELLGLPWPSQLMQKVPRLHLEDLDSLEQDLHILGIYSGYSITVGRGRWRRWWCPRWSR